MNFNLNLNVSRLWGKEKQLTELEHLQKYKSVFEKIPLPINTNHYETKQMLESLENGLFYQLLAKVFGPLQHYGEVGTTSAKEEQDKKYWMDRTWYRVTRHRESKDYAEAICEIFKPDAPFFKLLQHVSQPSPNFLNGLQTRWRTTGLGAGPNGAQGAGANSVGDGAFGDSEMEDNQKPRETYPVPLAVLWHQNSQLYAMPTETDLLAQSENKVPGLLLLPFWHPPMESKQMNLTAVPKACVSCSMASYFIIRMLGYLTMRSADHKDSLIETMVHTKPGHWKGKPFKLPNRVPTTIPELWGLVKDVAGIVDWKFISKQLEYGIYSAISPSVYEESISALPPVFYKLFMQYMQVFTPPSVLGSSIISHKTYTDLQWTTMETISGLLVHGGIHMWLKRKDVESELKRSRTQSQENMIITLFSLPYLELIWRQVSLDGNSKQSTQNESSGGARREGTLEAQGRRRNLQFTAIDKLGRGGNNDRTPDVTTAAAIVVDSQLFVYKAALGTLRQVMISLPMFASYTCTHLKSLLSLWHSLLNVGAVANGCGDGMWANNVGGGGGPDLASVLARRYEAYSNILVDFFAFSKQCNLVGKANVEVLVELSRVFATFRCGQTLDWLRTVSNHIQKEQGNPQAPTTAALRAQFSLSWVDEDDQYSRDQLQSYLFPVTTAEMMQRAFLTTYYPLKLRLKRHQEEGPTGDTYHQLLPGPGDYEKCLQAIGDCVTHMEAVFPGIADCKMSVGGSTNANDGRYNQHGPSNAMYAGQSRGEEAELLPTTDQKELYLKGLAPSAGQHRNAVMSKIKFQPGPTDTGDLAQAGGGGATQKTTMGHYKRLVRSNEIPFLVYLSLYLDVVVNWLARKVAPGAFPSSMIPTCDQCSRHLEVDPTQDSSCCVQPAQPGTWWCSYCSLSYSTAVKGPLCDAKGVTVTKSYSKGAASSRRWGDDDEGRRAVTAKTCVLCRLMLPPHSVVTLEYAANVYVCADCIGVTKSVRSTRVIANYNFWCLTLLTFVFYHYYATIFAFVYNLVAFVLAVVRAFLPF